MLAPLSFEAVVVTLCKALRHSREWMATDQLMWPPHHCVRVLEAAAAACKGHGEMLVSDELLRAAMHDWSVLDEVVDSYLITSDHGIEKLMMRADRVQFSLQRGVGWYPMSLAARIFHHHNWFTRTSKHLQQSLGFTISDWIATHIMLWAATEARDVPLMNCNYLQEVPSSIASQRALEKCLGHACWTQAELGSRYRDSYETNALQGGFARHAILDRPAVRFDRGVAVPIPALALHTVIRGAHRIAEVCRETFKQEMGSALATECDRIMLGTNQCVQHVSESELRAIGRGKVCDGLYVFDRSCVFIECKAIDLNAKYLDARVLANKASTIRELANGVVQLLATGVQVIDEKPELGHNGRNKRVVGIIITSGTFEQANSDWFWNEMIMPHLSNEEQNAIREGHVFRIRPQIMSLEAFDLFIARIIDKGHDPYDIIAEFDACRSGSFTEWSRYLSNDVELSLQVKALFTKPFEQLWNERFAGIGGPLGGI